MLDSIALFDSLRHDIPIEYSDANTELFELTT
jgi:hypothetical protein